MNDRKRTIAVLDDDPRVLESLAELFESAGYAVRAFASAQEFLAAYSDEPGCLVLDIRMPGMTGLELQRKLADEGTNIPVVMISGHADVRIAVEAMTLGAVTLLEKPFRLDELLAQQVPQADPPAHDELLFITVHQVYELWFQQLLYELTAVRDAMMTGETWRARHLLRRVHVIVNAPR